MKCPKCNNSVQDGSRFCSYCGEELVTNGLECPNCHSKDLPLDAKFCPDCGKPIPCKSEYDDIIVDNIILGQTTLRELRQRGYEMDNDEGMYTIDIGNNSVDVKLFCATYRNVEEFSRSLIAPSTLNSDFVLNRRKTVSIIGFDSFDDIEVFQKLGITDDLEDYEIAEILEDNDYIQIENIFDGDDEDVATFVRKHKDSAGNNIFLLITNSQSVFFVANIVNEWRSYKTGEVFYSDY